MRSLPRIACFAACSRFWGCRATRRLDHAGPPRPSSMSGRWLDPSIQAPVGDAKMPARLAAKRPTIAVWQYGSMAVWQYGSMAVWQYGSMAVWQYGSMAVWQYGSMAVWQYSSIAV
jgi:hypothetical protein